MEGSSNEQKFSFLGIAEELQFGKLRLYKLLVNHGGVGEGDTATEETGNLGEQSARTSRGPHGDKTAEKQPSISTPAREG